MHKTILILPALMLFGFIPLWASEGSSGAGAKAVSDGTAPPRILTVEDSIQAALAQNKMFQMENIGNEADRQNYDTRWNALIPGINATSGIEYRDNAISGITNGNLNNSGSPLNFNAGLSLSLPLNTGLVHKI
ncbi:MAG: TolC family protein, partial [Spirochaetales bacterium]|nr:TolC family protein [Spirochaetales bacterium]